VVHSVNGGRKPCSESNALEFYRRDYNTCSHRSLGWDLRIIGEERHSYARNLEYHHQAHNTWGTQYVSGFTPVPTFGPTTTNSFSFVGGIITDEDIQNSSILNDALYVSDGNLHKHCRIGYRAAGGATMQFDAIGTTYAKLNTGALQYDNAGTLTDVTNNQYGIMWIYATNRKSDAPIVSIVGQGQYTTIALAQAASSPTLAGLAVAEWKLLYRVICRKTVANPFFAHPDRRDVQPLNRTGDKSVSSCHHSSVISHKYSIG